jgi:type IV secretory pathway VirB10-like protein
MYYPNGYQNTKYIAHKIKTILDTIGQIITNSIDLNPVIRIPQGTKVTVIVNSDIKIPPVNSR